MLYFAQKLLDTEVVRDLRKRLLLCPDWIEGSNSAQGKNVKSVKRNLQLNTGKSYDLLSQEIINILMDNEQIKRTLFPSKIFNILFTRTGEGMYYGPHMDVPYISTGRRDLSFTIFLNNPENYKGGELILNIPPEQKTIKLKEGEIIVYPTKYLHEVKIVTEGERMVCVGWIQSQIERDDDRYSLTLLKSVLNELESNNINNKVKQDLHIAFTNIYKRLIS
mgnify:CR=1 FL=1|tara:strand:+ start:477 stop:1139 length:663 start_codon:yes stop_codon:yes gene_type:complete